MSDPKTFAKNLRWLCEFSSLTRFEIAEQVSNRLNRGRTTGEVRIKTVEEKLARWTSKGLRQVDRKSKEQIDVLLDLLGVPHLIDHYDELWAKTPEWKKVLQRQFALFACESYIQTKYAWAWQEASAEARGIVEEIMKDITTIPQSVALHFRQHIEDRKDRATKVLEDWKAQDPEAVADYHRLGELTSTDPVSFIIKFMREQPDLDHKAVVVSMIRWWNTKGRLQLTQLG